MFWDLLLSIKCKLWIFYIGTVYLIKEQILDRHRSLNLTAADGGGKTVVITGGSKGIGLGAVRHFLKLNCKVIIGCRDVAHAWKALADEDASRIHVLKLDLMQLESVRQFAQSILNMKTKIDVLVNNAGIMKMDVGRQETADGFELHFGTNYLSHFVLVDLLLPCIEASGTSQSPSRIVNVTSVAQRLGPWADLEDLHLRQRFCPELAYGNSKAAQVMFTQYLQSKLTSRQSNVRCISLHPGVVFTELALAGWSEYAKITMEYMLKSASQAGETLVYAALSPELTDAKLTGLYLENSQLVSIGDYSANVEYQHRLWEKSCDMVGIKNFGGL